MKKIPASKLISQIAAVDGVRLIAINRGTNTMCEHQCSQSANSDIPRFSEAAERMIEGLDFGGWDAKRVRLRSPELEIQLVPAGSFTVIVAADGDINSSYLDFTINMLAEKLEQGQVSFRPDMQHGRSPTPLREQAPLPAPLPAPIPAALPATIPATIPVNTQEFSERAKASDQVVVMGFESVYEKRDLTEGTSIELSDLEPFDEAPALVRSASPLKPPLPRALLPARTRRPGRIAALRELFLSFSGGTGVEHFNRTLRQLKGSREERQMELLTRSLCQQLQDSDERARFRTLSRRL